MSNAALDWAFRMPITGAAKAVLVALANLANKDGIAWPSTATIALHAGVAKRHVLRVLADLERRGAVKIERRNRAVSEYKLAIGTIVSGDMASLDGPNQSGDMVSPSGDISAFQHVKSGDMASSSGDMVSPKPLEPSKKEEPSITQRAHAREVAPPDGFAAFWSAYPRKVGKGQAERAYRTATKATDPDTILAALVAYPFDLGRPQFIPHASTWLNGKRWLDQIDTRDPVLAAVGFYDRDTGFDCQTAFKGFLQ